MTTAKKAQEDAEFVLSAQARLNDAVIRYFASYGICVNKSDMKEMCEEEPHKKIFDGLSKEIDVIMENFKLYNDMSTISSARKEKIMLTIYKIEETLQEHYGKVVGLINALAKVQDANALKPSVSPVPLLKPLLALAALSAAASFAASGIAELVGFLLFIFSATTIAILEIRSKTKLKKTTAAIQNKIAEANKEFDRVVVREITPRSKMPVYEIINS
ncbi:MAG: hypothetical protein FWC42_11075 [Proteobacteria bacterium]|nr:hypothetical protein [Pseudomonadota bacterium]